MSEPREINVVAIHYPKPDRIQEFRDLVLRVKSTFANNPGKLHHHAFETKTGEEIVVVERFKDQASLDQILATEEFKKIAELVLGLVRQPPTLINGTPLPGFEACGNQKGMAAFLADSHWV